MDVLARLFLVVYATSYKLKHLRQACKSYNTILYCLLCCK